VDFADDASTLQSQRAKVGILVVSVGFISERYFFGVDRSAISVGHGAAEHTAV